MFISQIKLKNSIYFVIITVCVTKGKMEVNISFNMSYINLEVIRKLWKI
ncbi:hypothetical protein ANASTE_01552 [Anaerofustis stercorihominis DSM 17244]|uniref:Uncharacterized protein n=1 Tax=Anaerofustis stercorihominis DSM 17244 TaxID=445971 RepID=B1CC52_9FIRM|nr:hypothetical protein ANASTE_01552 [Anaerofustis stercorihominis DSM 17244]